MPFNIVWHHFKPSDLPEPAYANELADCLLAARAKVAVDHSHLTDTELRTLVTVAYQASMAPDEGRYPRFQVVAHWSPDARQAFSLLTFDTPIVVTADNLRRLSPAFNHQESALRVRSSASGLVCDGVDSTDRSVGVTPGRPEFWAGAGTTAGMQLRVDGPGDIIASESLVTVRLKAGRLSDLVSIGFAAQWKAWRDQAAVAILAELKNRSVPDVDTLFGGLHAITTMVGHVMTEILARSVRAGHGGAIVLLPEAGRRLVPLRWPVQDLSLRTAAADYWELSARAGGKPSETDVFRHGILRNRLFQTIRSVAALTRIDGCVVLTPELDVRGAGGEIRVEEADLTAAGLIFTDLKSEAPWPDQSGVDLGGTRHRSAFRLCKAVRNSVAFVISQDGELTLLVSTDKAVHCIRGLTADAWAV